MRLACVIILLFSSCCYGAVHKDIPYVENGHKDQVADIYVPDKPGTFPVIVLACGGIWKTPDKAKYSAIGEAVAKRDCVLVVCNYRFLPDFKYPTPCEDFAKAIIWAYNNSWRYQGDPLTKVTVMGYSSGGLVACQSILNIQFFDKEGAKVDDIVENVISVSGVYELTWAVQMTTEGAFKDTRPQDASPINFISKPGPRFVILYGTKDFETVKVQSKAFHDKLKKNQYQSDLLIKEGQDHTSILDNPAVGPNMDEIFKLLLTKD